MKDALNWSTVAVKTFTLFQKIATSKEMLFFGKYQRIYQFPQNNIKQY